KREVRTTWGEKTGSPAAHSGRPGYEISGEMPGLGPAPDGVGVAPLAMAALDAHLAAAVIADDLLRRMLGRALGRIDPTGALRVRALDRPIRSVADHVATSVRHRLPLPAECPR